MKCELQTRSPDSREVVGRAMYHLIEELYPICRSITGPGLRQTLSRIGDDLQLDIHEVPSGTQVFDWEIPREWSIRDAYVKDATGQRVIDFQRSNLHVVNYSLPVRKWLSWHELRPHLFSLPDRPDWIPYRTTYYEENWGFCLSHRQLEQLARRPDEQYEVLIDSTLAPGSLSYGEAWLPGQTDEEVLFSCHVCHPSLANDNLAGVAVAVHLAQHVAERPYRRYGYRFLFLPGTIGPIAWLSQNEERARRIRHGLVLALLGDPGPMTYKRSRQGDAEIDQAVAVVLRDSADEHDLRDFSPLGYDGRQYGSPGFDLPVGCLMRTPNGEYPQYHTSADNLDLVQPPFLSDSLEKCVAIVNVLEANLRYLNLKPHGEPQLGKRGLYHAIGGEPDRSGVRDAMLWALNLSDGQHSLLDISQRSRLPFATVARAAEILEQHELLRPVCFTRG